MSIQTAERILVIGDLHSCSPEPAEQLIEEVDPDLTVFLGDYFDHFGDGLGVTIQMAQWLKQSLEQPNRVHLLGTHDLPYLYPGKIYCPGYSHEKGYVVGNIIDRNTWKRKSSLVYWHGDDWLFSHAGVSRSHLPSWNFKKSKIPSWLDGEISDAFNLLDSDGLDHSHWVWSVGSTRSNGISPGAGGLVWCDWYYDFEPIAGINQVVGHTPGQGIRSKQEKNSRNLCIDTSDSHGQHFPRQVLLVDSDDYEILSTDKPYDP